MTGRRVGTGAWFRAALVVVAVGLVVAGCSQSKPAAAPSRAAAPAPGKAAARQVRTDAARQVDSGDRQIAYVATEDVRVTDVAKAVTSAQAEAERLGGLVFGENVQLDAAPSAALTVKVPADQLRPALAAFGRLGTVELQKVTGEDVSATVTDVDGRLKTAQASADRLRALLATAAATDDLVALERELQQRETEIEGLTGQARTLQASVADATITLTLYERARPVEDKDAPGFFGGLRGGWNALVNLVRITLTAVGALLPFVPLFALGGFAAVRYRRWRRAHPKAMRSPAFATSAWPQGSRPPSGRPAPPGPPDPPVSS